MEKIFEQTAALRRENNWQGIVRLLQPLCREGRAAWNEPRALSELGFACTQVNALDNAKKYYQRWIEVEPDRAQPFYCLGYVFYLEQNWLEAIRWFDEALRIFPDYLVCLYRKGYAFFADGKSKKCIEPVARALGIYRASRDEDFRKRHAKTAVKAMFLLARALYQTKDYQNALAQIQSAFAHNKRGFIPTAHLHYALGKILTALHREDEALKHLGQALNRRHPQAYVLDQIGRVHHQIGDYQTALDKYGQALALRRFHYILFDRAMTFLALGKSDPAVRDLHEALKRDKLGKHKIYLELGKISIEREKWVEARHYLESAIQFKKKTYQADYAEAHYAMVFLHLKHGEKNLAKEAFQHALDINPNLKWDQNLRQILGIAVDAGVVV